MSDFLIYAARLQDAGVTDLWLRLGSNKDGMRTMEVTPNGMTPLALAERFPPRTFELCGTDRVLEKVKDDLVYADGGPTAERVMEAIRVHPLLADDLREFLRDWLLLPPLTDEDLAEAAEFKLDDAQVARSAQRMKDMLRGMDINRNRAAMESGNAA